jgi:hypothetical protein
MLSDAPPRVAEFYEVDGIFTASKFNGQPSDTPTSPASGAVCEQEDNRKDINAKCLLHGTYVGNGKSGFLKVRWPSWGNPST